MTERTKRAPFAEVIGKTLAGIQIVEGNTEGGCSVEVHFTDGTFVSVDLDPTVQASATLLRTAANGDYESVRRYGRLKVVC
jgi:hypothetical protein